MLNTKMLLLLASFSVARDATTAENKVTIPTTVASVIASVQTVERTVANLIHSDFTAAKKRTRLRTQTTPSGSSPFTGSSRISVCGSPSRADAMPRRWPMPSEKPIRFRAMGSSPVISMTSFTRVLPMPWVAPIASRWLYALRPVCTAFASSSEPTSRSGHNAGRNDDR